MAFHSDSIFWVEVAKIVANPYQPRREFDESKLQELSESVRMYGILQPLTVTRKEIERDDGAFYTEYELIAGERRLRAAKLAGLQQVPVIIREGESNEQEKLELAIIENLQREDLNAVDRALAFKQLADTFNLSHAKVAKKVGRSREYVSNTLRLLTLPDYMLDSLRVGDISEGHARTLLMLNDKPEELDTLYREILLKKLSVREVERITRKLANDKVRSKKWKDVDPELVEFEKKFTETLGTRVQISKTDFGGKLTIDYFSEEDLEKLLEVFQQTDNKHAASAVASQLSNLQHERAQSTDALTESTPLQHADPETPSVPETSDKPTDAPTETSVESDHTPRADHEPDESPMPQHDQVPSESSIQPDTSTASESTSEESVSKPVDDEQSHMPHETSDASESPTPQPHKQQPQQTPNQTPDDTSSEKGNDTTSEEDTAPETPSTEVKEEEDDSNLYAIRNFSV